MKIVRLVAVLAVFTAWLGPRDGESCGPFLPEAEFAPVRGPVDPAPYARGELGVLRPAFRTRDLFVAWRTLNGAPLSTEEAAAVYPPESRQPYVSPAANWMAARRAVPGLPPPKPVDTYRRSFDPKDFYYYPNCLDDAFDAAAQKLEALSKRWGASSEAVRDWAAAQDQVFENCSAGPAIPAPLAAGADPSLNAERAYQIAAAEFYAGKLDDAERDFRALATNPSAPYLVARTLIREGTLNKDPAKLRAAADQLNAIIAGPGPDRWKQAANGLLGYVQARLDPQQRLREVTAELMTPGRGSKVAASLGDFLYLWKIRDSKTPPQSDFGDWLVTFGSNDAKHSVERWRDSQIATWLIAALASSAPNAPAADDLIAAARQVKPADPAWPSAAYYGIRMERLRGRTDAARDWADDALSKAQSDATRNLLRAERLAMARNWTEFLRYSTRRPVAVNYDDGNPDQPLGPNEPKKMFAFDLDSVEPLNRMTPLSLWRDATSNSLVPADLQADVAQAGWVRAVVLEDRDSARAFATRLAQLRPDLAGPMHDYLAQTDPIAARFAAVFLMLRNPGLAPDIRTGLGRLSPVNKLDEFRDNWWSVESKGAAVAAPFLTEPDRAEGSREAEQLRSTAGNSVNYLAATAIDWAKSHPKDPRVPETLHLVVRATHYGSSADRTTSPYSKAAFDLLHRVYPDSPWAKQTKYWY